MNKIFSSLLFIFVLTGFVSATSYEANFSSDSHLGLSSPLEVSSIKYEPYPANPGEYFDLWIKAQWTGAGYPQDATFQLVPSYPFSLDPGEPAVKHLGQITSEPVVIKYKVRVSDDAVEGVNQLDLKYNVNGLDTSWSVKTFDIQVADAQTNFDLVVQDMTNSSVSLAIANTGKNPANSLIVRIPAQEDFHTVGTNGQMIGNLDAGDYSLASFNLVSSSRTSTNRTLKVQIDYTDTIGKRRSLLKDLQIGSNSISSGGLRRSFTQTSSSTSLFSNIWFWAVIVVLIVAYLLYRKSRGKSSSIFGKSKRESSSQNNKATPDWVLAEKAKRR